MAILGRDGTPSHDLGGGNPSPGRGAAPLSNPRPAETCSGAHPCAGARARVYTHGGTVSDLLHAFMTHLHLYEGVAVVLILAAIVFLIFLARRYAVTGPRPTRTTARNYRRNPAPRRG